MPTPEAKGIETDNYGFQKPTIGGDIDVWGSDYTSGDPAVDPSPGLNGNWSKMDVLLKAMEDRIAAIEASYQIPVGSLYLSATDADPAVTLGYGTWEQHASGRALVGVGEAGNGFGEWFPGQELGAPSVILTEAELPPHNHMVGPVTGLGTYGGGAHTHNVSSQDGNFLIVQRPVGGGGLGSGGNYEQLGSHPEVSYAPDHAHFFDIPEFLSGGVGSGFAHNNIQESIGVYVWKRTA